MSQILSLLFSESSRGFPSHSVKPKCKAQSLPHKALPLCSHLLHVCPAPFSPLSPLWLFSLFPKRSLGPHCQECPSPRYLFFFFLAALGLCCSTWASLVAVCGISCSEAREILVLLPGIELASPALEGRLLKNLFIFNIEG